MPNQASGDYRLQRYEQYLLVALCVVMLAGFAVSASVDPDPRGFGTHQQFGFPPCSFRTLLGIPCPACGGTTCFANYVRGAWPAAIRANVAAFLLACCCLAYIPWSIYSVLRGTLWRVAQPHMFLLRLLIVLCAVALAQWAWRWSA